MNSITGFRSPIDFSHKARYHWPLHLARQISAGSPLLLEEWKISQRVKKIKFSRIGWLMFHPKRVRLSEYTNRIVQTNNLPRGIRGFVWILTILLNPLMHKEQEWHMIPTSNSNASEVGNVQIVDYNYSATRIQLFVRNFLRRKTDWKSRIANCSTRNYVLVHDSASTDVV